MRAVNYDPYGHYWLLHVPTTFASSQTYTLHQLFTLEGKAEALHSSRGLAVGAALAAGLVVVIIVLILILGRIL